MMFNAPTVDGLINGRVHCTFRRWNAARARVGSRFTTRRVVIEVTSVERVLEGELTDADAAEAGFDSLKALLRWTSAKGGGDDLYRIGIVLAGPDPRVALRASDQLHRQRDRRADGQARPDGPGGRRAVDLANTGADP